MVIQRLVLGALLIAPTVWATTPEQAAFSAFQSALDNPALDLTVDGQATMEGLTTTNEAAQLGAQAARELIQGIQQPGATGGIADPEMAANWEALREHLQLGEEDRLYIFVSFSMPDSLLRAYAVEAGMAGAELIVRGVEEGTTLGEFLQDRVAEVLHPGAMTAPIQIDPRLFDTYAIERVPAIVLAREDPMSICLEQVTASGQVAQRTYEYQACNAGDPERFWKMEGAVTTLYALQEFERLGADNANPYIAALRNESAGADQELEGLSESAWTAKAEELAQRNAEMLRERYADDPYRDVYDTDLGPAVGPPGLPPVN